MWVSRTLWQSNVNIRAVQHNQRKQVIGITETEGSTNHKFNLVIDSFNTGIGKVKFGSGNNR